jgi:hypothetical protein
VNNGDIETNTGLLTIEGNGGAGGTNNNMGVRVIQSGASVTTTNADISITGTGGGTGTSTANSGVLVFNGGQVSAGGNGAVTVLGNGGNLAGSGTQAALKLLELAVTAALGRTKVYIWKLLRQRGSHRAADRLW